jgi:Tol biopolymer transport system component
LRFKLVIPLIAIILILSGCLPSEVSFTGPVPPARDVIDPEELVPELAQVRVFFREEDNEGGTGYFLRLDGTDPISLPEGCGVLSINERLVVCTPSAGLFTLDIYDLVSGERHVLLSKDEAFPDASYFSYPAFMPDGQTVIFVVAWSDHSNLATIDSESGEIEYLNVPGIMNIEPRVSPDGHTILVSCEGRQPGAGFVLCIYDMNSGIREYLVDESINVIPGSRFTPDGLSVVYSAPIGGINGEGHIYRIDLDDGDKHVLVSGLHSTDGVLGVTSDDVVFTCRVPERPTCSQICVVGLNGSDVRRLTYLGEQCIGVNEQ